MAESKDKLFGLIPLDWRYELTKFRPVRALLKSRWFPLLLLLFNLAAFMIVLMSAFVGGYSAGSYNFGIMMVWILWWVMLMFFLVPGFSRAWCMMCPFPMFSDWAQRGKLFDVKKRDTSPTLNLKWPKPLKNMWVMNIGFLVTTFFSGYMTVRPFSTFILLSGIIILAFITGLIFEKRSFCRYVCPISGFQGLYGQFAMAEVRRKDPEICRGHQPKTCVVGSDKGVGCPWMLAPFAFQKNTYCGMCLECFKTCPHDNMAFNLRPPGVDLLVDSKVEARSLDEAWKAFIMLGIAIVFYTAFQGPFGFMKDMIGGKTLSGYLGYISFHAVFNLLVIPAIFWLFCLASKILSGTDVPLKKIFINFAYTLIPLGLGVWITFSLGIILPNGSYILHILSDPFAWGWNLLGTAGLPWTPVFTNIMGYLQGATMVVYFLFSVAYGTRIARQTFPSETAARRGWLPILAYITLMTCGFLWLFIG